MDFLHTQNQPKNNSNNKKRLTEDQVRVLERTFTTNKKLEPELKLQLANQLGVPPRQVAIWYQNKRARWKTQNLELDYNTLQVKLENALVDRRRLEKEVIQLKDQLRKFNEMGFGFDPNPNHHYHQLVNTNLPNNYVNNGLNNGSCNSSYDEGGSSSFHEDVNNNGEVLQLDELYACFVGSNGSVGATWG